MGVPLPLLLSEIMLQAGLDEIESESLDEFVHLVRYLDARYLDRMAHRRRGAQGPGEPKQKGP